MKYEKGSFITSSGALATLSGAKTGRSPRDKRVVKDKSTEDDLWWGKYLNSLDKVYVNDQFLNWDPEHQIKVRIVSARAYHSLFMHNMCIRPTAEELENFGTPDFTIYNAGKFPCNYMTSSTSIDINLSRKEMVILGTQYAGETKKGLFGLMHYLMPKRQILSLHSGCNMGKDGDVALFFGLSVLENVVFDEHTCEVDYTDKSNTRAAYPIEYIPNAKIPCVGPHPKNVILLSCDAFGVLHMGSTRIFRIKLPYTRKIIDDIHSGSLLNASYTKTEVFGLEVPNEVEGVPSEILDPMNFWADKQAYKDTLLKLAGLFRKNFDVFANNIGRDNSLAEEILAAGPIF
ncbi:hypothetical protein MKX01_021495 [Papaver californicum]|nr:hypothetical protein MKX01_021495 [Papaver californicum]